MPSVQRSWCGLRGAPGPEMRAGVVADVAHRDRPPPGRRRRVAARRVQRPGVVDHDVTRLGGEREDLALAGRGQRVDVGHRGTLGAGNRIVGDEQRRPVGRVPSVRAAGVADRARRRRHRIERAPRGRELVAVDVEVAEVLVPARRRRRCPAPSRARCPRRATATSSPSSDATSRGRSPVHANARNASCSRQWSTPAGEPSGGRRRERRQLRGRVRSQRLLDRRGHRRERRPGRGRRAGRRRRRR